MPKHDLGWNETGEVVMEHRTPRSRPATSLRARVTGVLVVLIAIWLVITAYVMLRN